MGCGMERRGVGGGAFRDTGTGEHQSSFVLTLVTMAFGVLSSPQRHRSNVLFVGCRRRREAETFLGQLPIKE